MLDANLGHIVAGKVVSLGFKNVCGLHAVRRIFTGQIKKVLLRNPIRTISQVQFAVKRAPARGRKMETGGPVIPGVMKIAFQKVFIGEFHGAVDDPIRVSGGNADSIPDFERGGAA